MSWLFNAIYLCFLTVASPWLLWRRVVQGKNRRGWSQKLFGNVDQLPCLNGTQQRIWMHAVSVGEVILLEPIIDRLLSQSPDVKIVISTTTETGFDLASRKFSDQYIFFCPFDFSWAIRRVVKRIRPDMLMLAELELWPNLIRIVHKTGVPVAVANARMSGNSFRGYKRLRWLVTSILEKINLVAAQNETYAARFRALGCESEKVIVTGSVKFDGVETDRENPRTQKLKKLAGIKPSESVFIAGSTQLEEDLIGARVFKTLAAKHAGLRLILVPRHPGRCGALVQQLHQMEIPFVLRSKLDVSGSSLDPSQVLVVDVIGELGAWWGCADVAYVGGSMGKRGGQNMLEPAAYGVPTSFGPSTENFKAIVAELLANDGAKVVRSQTELLAFVDNALTDLGWSSELGQRSKNVVIAHAGAAQRTAEALCFHLDSTREGQRARSEVSRALETEASKQVA